MKTRKLIERIKALFDADLRLSLNKQQSLHQVLEQLRLKQKKLQAELLHEQDSQRRDKLQLKIDLVHSQRKKGLILLKQAQADAGPVNLTAAGTDSDHRCDDDAANDGSDTRD
ncbi:MAG: hypothetical protein V7707_10655 [Motiliproteus sp.]